MPTDVGRGSRSIIGSSIGLVFPVLVVLSVLVLIAPVPPFVLDLLLAANVTASVLVLLTTISVRKPLDFSSFPSLLLVTTLIRLVLNVASTRLILTRAHVAGTDARILGRGSGLHGTHHHAFGALRQVELTTQFR